jgi:hypothetical protein
MLLLLILAAAGCIVRNGSTTAARRVPASRPLPCRVLHGPSKATSTFTAQELPAAAQDLCVFSVSSVASTLVALWPQPTKVLYEKSAALHATLE